MEHEQERSPDRRRSEAGQTMAEYAVVLAIITVIIVASLTAFGDALSGMIDGIVDVLG